MHLLKNSVKTTISPRGRGQSFLVIYCKINNLILYLEVCQKSLEPRKSIGEEVRVNFSPINIGNRFHPVLVKPVLVEVRLARGGLAGEAAVHPEEIKATQQEFLKETPATVEWVCTQRDRDYWWLRPRESFRSSVSARASFSGGTAMSCLRPVQGFPRWPYFCEIDYFQFNAWKAWRKLDRREPNHRWIRSKRPLLL
jgi:hypothetical protein